MPTRFERFARVAARTVDAVFSERFLLFPQAQPALPASGGLPDVNARPIASPAREPIPFAGTFVAKGAILHAHGRAMADKTTRPIVAERPMIDVPRAALPTLPLNGDRVQRFETGELFELVRVLPEDDGRVWLHLAERRAPACPER